MREEGCEVELFYTCRLRVKPCLGDRACWTKTPGKCVQNDDVKMLLPKIQRADVIVFATPVYVDGIAETFLMCTECREAWAIICPFCYCHIFVGEGEIDPILCPSCSCDISDLDYDF